MEKEYTVTTVENADTYRKTVTNVKIKGVISDLYVTTVGSSDM